mmetsp:Transcript_20552/g.42316  ORF Transcript_20552/g.42316 Transcript_20552/m.42316 type:complete len:161 (-) Transcript_20552:1858-2340(-)
MSSPSAEISSGDADYVNVDPKPKRGHIFCGVCCDVRTACLVVNIVSLAFAGLGLISLAPQMDRPGFERFGILMAAFVIGIVCNAVGLYGALKFKKMFTLIAAIWFGIEAILSLVMFMDFIGFAIAILFLYPHVMFYKELQDGIMSRENYAYEKNCCNAFC